MVSWSTKRKIAYLGITFSVIFVIIFSVFLTWYYESPTCFDGKKNGDETGLDCGGSCELLCASDSLSPIVLWQRTFKVSSGVYNALAYVENPNVRSEARRVSYAFSLFDSRGVLLAKREGVASVPANRKIAIFEGNINIKSGVPVRTVFAFQNNIVWQKPKNEPIKISVKNSNLSKADVSPRVDAVLSNESFIDARNVQAVVIVSDEKGNALGASKTFVDYIPKTSDVPIVFTWPEPFDAEVGLCKRPVDVMLAIDRSGSMDDDSPNPPQPLTDVKDAALSFIDQLSSGDRAGLVSFGTSATNPPDKSITSDFESLKDGVRSISIVLNGGQNTNIGDGILRAREELGRNSQYDGVGKFIVLLTDGIATHPQNSNDDLYPEKYAEFEAGAAKRDKVDIFTIGLGNKVNVDFLKRISSGEDYSFTVLKSTDLKAIYANIASEICKKGPVVIEIIPIVENY